MSTLQLGILRKNRSQFLLTLLKVKRHISIGSRVIWKQMSTRENFSNEAPALWHNWWSQMHVASFSLFCLLSIPQVHNKNLADKIFKLLPAKSESSQQVSDITVYFRRMHQSCRGAFYTQDILPFSDQNEHLLATNEKSWRRRHQNSGEGSRVILQTKDEFGRGLHRKTFWSAEDKTLNKTRPQCISFFFVLVGMIKSWRTPQIRWRSIAHLSWHPHTLCSKFVSQGIDLFHGHSQFFLFRKQWILSLLFPVWKENVFSTPKSYAVSTPAVSFSMQKTASNLSHPKPVFRTSGNQKDWICCHTWILPLLLHFFFQRFRYVFQDQVSLMTAKEPRIDVIICFLQLTKDKTSGTSIPVDARRAQTNWAFHSGFWSPTMTNTFRNLSHCTKNQSHLWSNALWITKLT